MSLPHEIQQRVEQFCARRRTQLVSRLGAGTQGTVFLVSDLSRSSCCAVKFHYRQLAYLRERDVYLRLRELKTVDVCGHEVPQLIDYDDQLLAISMSTVSPPFVLDFGGAYLDQPPDYSPEVWADWRAMKAEAFEGNWPEVERILAEFRSYGIYIADVNPGNIRF